MMVVAMEDDGGGYAEDVVRGELVGVDLVGYRGEVVASEGEVLTVGYHGLAGGPEPVEGSAKLLHVGNAAGGSAVGQVYELDGRIGGRIFYGLYCVQDTDTGGTGGEGYYGAYVEWIGYGLFSDSRTEVDFKNG